MSWHKASFLVLIFVSLTSLSLGSQAIPNWPAPETWSPARAARGVTIQGDITNPLPFIGVTPCRVVDTRGPNGTFGGPIFAAAETRTYPLSTNPACPGFPSASTIAAYSVNITVTQTAGTGFVSAYPSGTTRPTVSSVNFVGAGVSISNAAIVPAGSGVSAGKIDVYASQQTHVIIDVNGYYCDGALGALVPGETFTLVGDVSGVSTGLLSVHNTEGVAGARAGYFVADSSGFGSTGIAGIETATSGLTAGVYGQASSSTTNTAGVSGVATSTTGVVYGVYGKTGSSSFSSSAVAAGVYGVQGAGTALPLAGGLAGVFGVSSSEVGVLGYSKGFGVIGWELDSLGSGKSGGTLGYSSSVGVEFENGLAGTGTKSFVEPHPTDASKVIRYVSLEGPEAGTYFRGRGRFERGIATIELPDSFRMVTDSESLSIQVTPIGEITGVAVVRIGIDGIVVKASRDVEFFYTVNGVRRAYNHWDPVQENEKFFVPESPQAKLPKYLSEEERGRLIANGTYNADGTVNMVTAERVGWTKMWADREAQSKDAAETNAVAHAPMTGERK